MNLFNKSSKKAFTLIELLVVIAVLGVLAAGVLIAIDPIDKLNAAGDSKAQTDVAALANAAEAYAVAHNGFYTDGPITDANPILVSSGETKIQIIGATGYTYTYDSISGTPAANSAITNGCSGGSDCTGVIITSNLKSKKFSSTPEYKYSSFNGKTCSDTVARHSLACP